ncbi:hypothetical protein bsdtb5_23250 [Anaeromicropila herbilytica]|uniref:Uncharacterized protein n=1 Tax=Anaeromicropila herbilytica TaxID=2785025 RepID=A0A7R7EL40_9FIRM|nr:hypothetical protein bsdtb5_23250 [Anaeromicropila herbilytica]
MSWGQKSYFSVLSVYCCIIMNFGYLSLSKVYKTNLSYLLQASELAKILTHVPIFTMSLDKI